ncbi:MAG: Fpg/Nei family DNA glycosylase [Actinomycetes bacterium]
MPELIEVEQYRLAASATVGRSIVGIDVPDRSYLKRGLTPNAARAAVLDRRVVGVGRHGKVMWLELDDQTTLAMRFGMTGRIVVDGVAPITQLLYSASPDQPTHERFAVDFAGGGRLAMVDPRRLGGVEVSPDLTGLGVDAASVTAAELTAAIAGARASVKAALLDQHRIAGVGNLIADETLWRARIDPGRSAADLSGVERRRLATELRSTIRLLTRRGGSHTGDLQEQRRRRGVCPRCGTELLRRALGGRTTFSCPEEQR